MELLSPTKTINLYGAFRNNGIYKGEVIENEILSEFSEFENCQPLNYENFQKIKKQPFTKKVVFIATNCKRYLQE